MASNQTAHLKLCQWEADDEVLRADFNADNEKIDSALAQMQDAVQTAYSPNQKPFVVGTYTGDGASTRVISLGFTPTAVLISDGAMTTYQNGSYYSGFATRDCGRQLNGLVVVEGGFQVGVDSRAQSNCNGASFHYIAFR